MPIAIERHRDRGMPRSRRPTPIPPRSTSSFWVRTWLRGSPRLPRSASRGGGIA